MKELIQKSQLEKILLEQYEIETDEIIDAPRGFVAETYYVKSKSETFFVKIIDATSRYIENVLDSLEPVSELHKNGITFINNPITAKNGDLFYKNMHIALIVFNYIKGEWGFHYDKSEYLKRLKQIHDIDYTQLKSDIKKESFQVNFKDELMLNLEKLKKHSAIQKQIIIDFKKVDKISKKFEMISSQCKQNSFNLKITHGDASGNVIINGSDIFIIDWDDILIAPIERDLWFHIRDKELKTVYRQYVLNDLAYSFYLYRRYLDDLSGFLDKIFNNLDDEKIMSDNIRGIKEDINGWLEPLVDDVREG